MSPWPSQDRCLRDTQPTSRRTVPLRLGCVSRCLPVLLNGSERGKHLRPSGKQGVPVSRAVHGMGRRFCHPQHADKEEVDDIHT